MFSIHHEQRCITARRCTGIHGTSRKKFSIPVLGVLAGTILTAVIQSSSASVGILQALCATGSVGYAVAIPIIMGQNIGTCITALLSSIGTSRHFFVTAMVHLLFNIIGTVLFLVLFYGINAFVHFSIPGNLGKCSRHRNRSLRFNIFATLILFPFADGLVKLAKLTIRTDRRKSRRSCSDARYPFPRQPGFLLCSSVKLQPQNGRTDQKNGLVTSC